MKRLVKHLELIGLKPYKDFSQNEYGVTYSDGSEGWISVNRWYGKIYKAEYVKVYTKDAIRVSKFESTRMNDIVKWIDSNLGVSVGGQP